MNAFRASEGAETDGPAVADADEDDCWRIASSNSAGATSDGGAAAEGAGAGAGAGSDSGGRDVKRISAAASANVAGSWSRLRVCRSWAKTSVRAIIRSG